MGVLSMQASQLSFVLVVALGLSACGSDKTPEQSGSEAASEPMPATSGGPVTSGEVDDSSTGAPMPVPTTTSGTSEATPTSTGSPFIVEPDGGVSGQCDPRTQDCPEGQKCTAVSDAPGEPWGLNTCVEASGQGEVGDPCDVEDGKYTGIDNCKEGALCLLTDDDGKGGVCVEFCDASDACPQTPTANCVVYNDGSLPICLPACDPLIQDCPEGLGCYNSAGDLFVCFKVSAMPGEGMPGAPCQYINQCQAGTFCAGAAGVANCPEGSNGCCTPYCAVSGGAAPCQAGEDCVPFFEEGMAPPAYADVGVCAIPA